MTDRDGMRTLGPLSELPDEWARAYYLEDLKHRVAVARVGDQLFAFDDLYIEMPLSAGLLTGTIIMSQGDGSQWELRDGSLVRGPATEALVMYDVREVDGNIQVKI